MNKLFITILLITFSTFTNADSRCEVFKTTEFVQNGRNSYTHHLYITQHTNPEHFAKCVSRSFDDRLRNCSCVLNYDVVSPAEIKQAVKEGIEGTSAVIANDVAKKINEQFGKQLEENKKANFDALARIKQDVVKLLNDIQSIFFE